MKKQILALAAIFALSCNNDDNGSQPSQTDINLVTGINFRQNFDDPSYQLGNPNIFVEDKFIIYPNPANNVIYFDTENDISDVWFVPANPENIYQEVNFTTIFNANSYSEQSIIADAVFSHDVQEPGNFSLNVEALEKGYYKVFAKIGGQIYWDNLYKYDTEGSNEEQIAPIIAFWN